MGIATGQAIALSVSITPSRAFSGSMLKEARAWGMHWPSEEQVRSNAEMCGQDADVRLAEFAIAVEDL